MRILLAAIAAGACAGCAAQSDVSAPAATQSAQAALGDLAALAHAGAPRETFDAPLAALETALAELGVSGDRRETGRGVAAPVRAAAPPAEPPPRPTPAELDRRQHDLGGQLRAGPTARELGWRETTAGAWRELESAAAGTPLDHSRVAVVVERLAMLLARRPEPDPP